MRRTLILLLVLLGAVAHAAPKHRFHFLTPDLVKHLTPGARRNVAATVNVGAADGTGIVIDRARGLVLTNSHVAAEAPAKITLPSGKVSRVHEVVLDNPKLDYAVLRVGRLPKETGEAVVGLGDVKGTRQLYSISAAAMVVRTQFVKDGLLERDPAKFLRKHRDRVSITGESGRLLLGLANQYKTVRENRDFPTIQMGEVRHKGKIVPTSVSSGGRSRKIPSIETRVPHAPGGSGSGMFHPGTDELVALHFSGGDGARWDSSEVPLSLIYADAQRRIAKTATSGTGRTAVQGWLADVARRAAN